MPRKRQVPLWLTFNFFGWFFSSTVKLPVSSRRAQAIVLTATSVPRWICQNCLFHQLRLELHHGLRQPLWLDRFQQIIERPEIEGLDRVVLVCRGEYNFALAIVCIESLIGARPAQRVTLAACCFPFPVSRFPSLANLLIA